MIFMAGDLVKVKLPGKTAGKIGVVCGRAVVEKHTREMVLVDLESQDPRAVLMVIGEEPLIAGMEPKTVYAFEEKSLERLK